MTINLTLARPVRDSFRVQQVAGMFGLNVDEHCRERFSVEVPGLDEPWQIGAIVGPSGSGKTSVARAAFGECFARGHRWPRDRAVIDCFGERSIREITHVLSAVGLSSPPAWLKPYGVLSTGERFRCDLARALAEVNVGWDKRACERGPTETADGGPALAKASLSHPTLTIDEFTSVIDRTTARFASAAISRAIRSGKIACRLVAVTCHRDMLPWLQPDWVLDMGTRELTRGRLRRPPIRLRLIRGRRDAWPQFARHHYLDAALPRGVTIYIGEILESELEDGLPRPSTAEEERGGLGRPSSRFGWQPAAFCAWGAMFGRRNVCRIARLVVLPQYQGVGIGSRVLKACCELIRQHGRRATITTSHPTMIAHLATSPDWQIRAVKPLGGNRCGVPSANYRASTGRPVVSAEFVGG
jgi:GNAT superfamily N-acetyltransferase